MNPPLPRPRFVRLIAGKIADVAAELAISFSSWRTHGQRVHVNVNALGLNLVTADTVIASSTSDIHNCP